MLATIKRQKEDEEKDEEEQGSEKQAQEIPQCHYGNNMH